MINDQLKEYKSLTSASIRLYISVVSYIFIHIYAHACLYIYINLTKLLDFIYLLSPNLNFKRICFNISFSFFVD